MFHNLAYGACNCNHLIALRSACNESDLTVRDIICKVVATCCNHTGIMIYRAKHEPPKTKKHQTDLPFMGELWSAKSVIMSCKNAMLSHALVNRADDRLDRTMAPVVRRNPWPEGIL